MSSSIPASTPGKPWQPPAPENLAPELPAYEILGLLGRGGMGAVYKARQKSLDREVAIKILPPMVDEDDSMHYAERFIAEARAMGRLEHGNIVAVYDAGQTPGGLLYFVMQYVQGTDVAQMIQSSGKLPPEHAHAITAHVCDALAYAHKNGIIHRDIKPANIMVDMEGRVKVADFGLAKAVDAQTGFTQSNMAVGTPDFVAPEALIPGMPVDARADLYAVGVMLYQMLTGNIPRGAWQPASVVVPGTDLRFDQIIVKAMAYDREQRHQSATELRQHLDTLLMPAVAAPDLQQYGNAQISEQGKPTAVVTKPDGWTKATPSSRSEAPPPEKSKTPFMIGIGAAAVIGISAFVMFSDGEKAKLSGPHASPSGTNVAQSSGSPSKAAGPAAPPSQPAPETPKSEPKPVVVTKAPEPAETKPAAPEPKKEDPQPVVATPAMAVPVKPVVLTQTSAEPKVETITPAVSPSLPPELAALDAQFIALQKERVTAPFEADVAKLNSSYLDAITKKITEEKAAGYLDGILALEAEQKLLTAKQPVPESDDDKTPGSLKALRAIYREQFAKLTATRAANLKALIDPLDRRLAMLEVDFTKADRLADAKTVRSYREALDGGSEEDPPAATSVAMAATTSNLAVERASTPPMATAADLALKDSFTNSLGMKFLRVKGTAVLFCIHETRRQDYAAYAAGVPGVDDSWKNQNYNGIPCGDKDDHPVVGVSWQDAVQFCQWLSKREGKTYRLPTDEEWSIAVGLGHKEKRDKGITPEMLNQKEQTEFPWGDYYPPKTKDKVGNYSDSSRLEKFSKTLILKDYTDGFPTTAPVMNFKPNQLGLYDMGGNVWEWIDDWWNDSKTARVLRGGSFQDSSRNIVLSSHRIRRPPNLRYFTFGFRVVLEAP